MTAATTLTPGNPPRVALITGSGRARVGQVIARYLARHGYQIALHYHYSAAAAQHAVAELRDLGVDAAAFAADVTQPAEVDRLFAAVRARFSRLDALVTAASTWEPTPLATLTADQFRASFDVNTLGTFLCAQRAGQWMAEQPEGGAIVTLGDAAMEHPYPGYSAYFAAKGAVVALSRALAVEFARLHPRVRVNCLQLGAVLASADATPGERAARAASTLVQFADRPETVAHAVLFLLENPFVTGISLPLDGGRSLRGIPGPWAGPDVLAPE